MLFSVDCELPLFKTQVIFEKIQGKMVKYKKNSNTRNMVKFSIKHNEKVLNKEQEQLINF